MKKLNKSVTFLMALIMCMSLCASSFALAAEVHEYTVTVEKSSTQKTYKAYKIFDATYDGNGNVSYSISPNSAWYDIIEKGYYIDEEFFVSPFVLIESFSGSGVYTVTLNSETSSQKIIEFFSDYYAKYGVPANAAASAEGKGTGGDLVLNVKEPGYYFVTTATGSLVSITTAAPSATVIDKSTAPGSLNKEIAEGDHWNHESHENDDFHTDTEAIGDDLKFIITADAPLYDSSNLVIDYTFEDTMGNGLCIELGVNDVVSGSSSEPGNETGKYYLRKTKEETDEGVCIDDWVTIGSADNSEIELKLSGNTFVGDYYLELIGVQEVKDEKNEVTGYTATGFILYYTTFDTEYIAADGDTGADVPTGDYPADATIRIEYVAHVTSAAVYDNANTVTMHWNETPFSNPDPTNPQYEGSVTDRDDVYVLSLTIIKKDAKDHDMLLEGAEFTIEGTNLHDVVISTTVTYTPLTSIDEYKSAIENGSVIYFKLLDNSYTTVNPYELNNDNPDLDKYEKTENPDPDYEYAGYIRNITSSAEYVETGDDHYATGITDTDGRVTFNGLTWGQYTITEVVAPDGYNLMGDQIKITITFVDDTPVFSVDGDYKVDENGNIEIIVFDQAGTELPGTGGIGTTIFYVIGICLMLGAGVVLVTRRRMNHAE